MIEAPSGDEANIESVKDSDHHIALIEASAVSRDPSQDVDFTGKIIDADRFGNILHGLLWAVDDGPEGHVYYASRRDDCYNRDGSRPDWCVKAAGRLDPIEVSIDDWKGADRGEIIRWTVQRSDTEDITRSDGEIELKIWNQYHGFEDVTFAIDGDV